MVHTALEVQVLSYLLFKSCLCIQFGIESLCSIIIEMKVPGLEIKAPKDSAFRYETPQTLTKTPPELYLCWCSWFW